MTEAEFWKSEAEQEGIDREGWELHEEFLNAIQDDLEKSDEQYRNPQVAMDVIVPAMKHWNESDPDEIKLPIPSEILEVVDVNCGLRSFHLRVRAIRDGIEDFLDYYQDTDPDDRMNPGSFDENFVWEGLDDDGNPIKWEHFYTIGRGNVDPNNPRLAKANFLLDKITRGGTRARIYNNILEVQDRDKALKVLGRVYLDQI